MHELSPYRATFHYLLFLSHLTLSWNIKSLCSTCFSKSFSQTFCGWSLPVAPSPSILFILLFSLLSFILSIYSNPLHNSLAHSFSQTIDTPVFTLSSSSNQYQISLLIPSVQNPCITTVYHILQHSNLGNNGQMLLLHIPSI